MISYPVVSSLKSALDRSDADPEEAEKRYKDVLVAYEYVFEEEISREVREKAALEDVTGSALRTSHGFAYWRDEKNQNYAKKIVAAFGISVTVISSAASAGSWPPTTP
ncbi:uncharacterized protein LOC112349962 [Selaginella moellendorffii]|uniref:uncharacterized protein LOC112349962 n=1 Tax=Selaginella moellendorffii TaxID=88036 RepID=UPI000D1CADA5|nr:uncharacterized protein LOC112349962 [Selaginella moellendorffii]|eukprot:XP_024541038.1 uncharacterized protein LOC112349962 [Selaginella moellendorffii]